MKKKVVTIVSVVILCALILAGCGGTGGTGATSASSAASASAAAGDTKVFTLQELAKYNGQNGNPAYVAINGVVYDMSAIGRWAGGKHQGLHVAGTDLSSELKKAPHGTSVLKLLPVVGKLEG